MVSDARLLMYDARRLMRASLTPDARRLTSLFSPITDHQSLITDYHGFIGSISQLSVKNLQVERVSDFVAPCLDKGVEANYEMLFVLDSFGGVNYKFSLYEIGGFTNPNAASE